MNLQKMMKQAQEMQNKFSQLQERLGDEEAEGSSGGGMVTAVMNGKGTLRRLNIDPSLLEKDEKETLEDLIIAAVNNAKAKLDETANAEMQKLSSGMGLPAGMKLPF